MDTADHKSTPPPRPPQPPAPKNDPNPSSPKSFHDSSCSSSDSDTNSDDDFFQIDVQELAHPPLDPLIDHIPKNLASAEISLSGKYLNSRRVEPQSPAVQVMARNHAGDVGRIPSSIFSRSSPTPMEWSVASNESLFSIHMGNSSFSKDQVFLTGRSGELGGFTSGLMDYPPPILSPAVRPVGLPGGSGRGGMVDLEKMEEAAASANAEAMRDVMRAAAEEKESEREREREREREKPKTEPLGHSISRHSDGSNTSFRSFAFPILTGDGRIGSTKVDSMHHVEHHPLSPVTPLKAVAAPTDSSQAPARASTRSLWFPCFSCCRFCC